MTENPEKSKLVFRSAVELLSRQPEDNYVSDWTTILAQQLPEQKKEGQSVIIFRLATEWLAIATSVFSEVIPSRKIHRIPHRSNEVLMGVVNYEGGMTLCVNMHHFLSIDMAKVVLSANVVESFQRMLAIQKDRELWIFPVDEVYGVFHCDLTQFEKPPVTVSKSRENYLRAIFRWNEKSVGLLDESLLFYSLKRSFI